MAGLFAAALVLVLALPSPAAGQVAPAAPAGGDSLTLVGAVRRAVDTHPSVRVAEAAENAVVRARVELARAAGELDAEWIEENIRSARGGR